MISDRSFRLNFEKKSEFFSFCSLSPHIQLKFDLYIHLRNKQFKFEFGCGPMILDKVSSLECLKDFEFLCSPKNFGGAYSRRLVRLSEQTFDIYELHSVVK
jgi:hypothetical protein